MTVGTVRRETDDTSRPRVVTWRTYWTERVLDLFVHDHIDSVAHGSGRSHGRVERVATHSRVSIEISNPTRGLRISRQRFTSTLNLSVSIYIIIMQRKKSYDRKLPDVGPFVHTKDVSDRRRLDAVHVDHMRKKVTRSQNPI